jgi:hypothetical protein
MRIGRSDGRAVAMMEIGRRQAAAAPVQGNAPTQYVQTTDLPKNQDDIPVAEAYAVSSV